MPEVLEIEQVEVGETRSTTPKWDSWTVEIPQEVIRAQGLAEGTVVVLTYADGRIESTITTQALQSKEISKRILVGRRGAYEELKRLGD